MFSKMLKVNFFKVAIEENYINTTSVNFWNNKQDPLNIGIIQLD